VRFKLDENLSPSLVTFFTDAKHDAHSFIDQALSGKSDERVIEVCRREQRALVTFDLDFSNILRYPPGHHAGIIVLRLSDQAHSTAARAIQRVVELVDQESVAGTLWIVEDTRVRIHGTSS
jgi:predicted nuclease of predicted toxin-antitoxin system